MKKYIFTTIITLLASSSSFAAFASGTYSCADSFSGWSVGTLEIAGTSAYYTKLNDRGYWRLAVKDNGVLINDNLNWGEAVPVGRLYYGSGKNLTMMLNGAKQMDCIPR